MKDIVEQWISNSLIYRNGMEVIFYEVMKNNEEILKLDYEEFEGKIEFNKIKKYDTYGFNYMFFFDDNDNFYFNIFNSGKDLAQVELKIDGNYWFNTDLVEGGFYIDKINLSNFMDKKVTEIVKIGDDIMIFEKNINEKIIKFLKKSQKITFF